MIEPEIKSLDFVDALPSSADESAMLAMTIGIGERGKEGRDNFQIVVCTPAWIAEKAKESNGLWPRGMLVVPTIEPEHVRAAVQALVSQFRQSKSWVQFAERLNRYLLWEFEDYNDYQGEPSLPR